MFLQNLSDADMIRSLFEDKSVDGSQIQNCIMDGISVRNTSWNNVSMRDTNANDAAFTFSSFTASSISRSSLVNTSFSSCMMNSLTFSGVTLIKTKWIHIRGERFNITQSAMQRAVLKNTILRSSVVSDFEGISASVQNCIFISTRFEITGGGGMNGFSGADISDSIFIGCSFSGYPFRGAHISSCVFYGCRGEITDDCEAEHVTGLPHFSSHETMELTRRGEAERMITCCRRSI